MLLTRFIAAALLVATLLPLQACSTVSMAAPAGAKDLKFAAADAKDCKVRGTKTVHSGFWGSVTADKEGVTPLLTGSKPLRVTTSRQGHDGFLTWLGTMDTVGLYSGSVTYTVEECAD